MFQNLREEALGLWAAEEGGVGHLTQQRVTGMEEGVSRVYCLAGRCGGLSRSLGDRINSDRSRKVGSDLLWLPLLNIASVSLPGLDRWSVLSRKQSVAWTRA